LTPRIVMSNGELDFAAHRGLPTPWASFKYFFLKDDSLYHLSKSDFNKPHEVDAISGSFLLTRKDVLEKSGIFDEDYWMYAEDIDLSYRIKKAGFKIIYLPNLEVLHHKGISSGLKKHSQGVSTATLETKKRSLDAFYYTMKIFYRKHLAKKHPFFINWLVYLGINIKWWLAKRKLIV
jgi:GT2 family glycosyltransferase